MHRRSAMPMLTHGLIRPGLVLAALALLPQAALASVAESDETPAPNPEAVEERDVEAVLSDPLGDDEYRVQRNCIWRRQIESVEIIDESLVVFHGRVRGKIRVNKLSQSCVGLRRHMIVTTGSRGGSICQMGTLSAKHRGNSPFEEPVRCWLGKFDAISETQLEALKRAIEEREKTGDAGQR